MASVRLYPPIVEGIIPAFFGNTITIPYAMNRAVGATEVAGFMLRMRTVNGDLKETATVMVENAGSGSVSFTLKETYTLGEFYKAQIAYVDRQNNPGYFSTVSVIKYTTFPKIYIEGLDDRFVNPNKFGFVGVFEQEDVSEKLYSGEFKIYNAENQLIYTSGTQIHDVSEDDNNGVQYENFKFTYELESDVIYYIVFVATSINNLVVSSPRYALIQQKTISAEAKVNIEAKLNFEQAYIQIKFTPAKDGVKVIPGRFLLSRRALTGDNAWEEVAYFDINSINIEEWCFNDYSIKHGLTYQYSYQEYNRFGIYSDRILSNEIYADFEDMFLWDGKRQLNIRFNPTVSSYKNTVLETKVNTIGSKYPYIMRNGNVNYKEFPIGGLVSYLMDEAELFSSKKDILWKEDSTGYSPQNICTEKEFKNQVLDWLSNGEPKLFKSPTEGNFVVRLLNVQMTPQASTSRMIHSFAANASQVGEADILTFQKLGLLAAKYTEDIRNVEYGSIVWADIHLDTRLEKLEVEKAAMEEKIANETNEGLIQEYNDELNYINANIESILNEKNSEDVWTLMSSGTIYSVEIRGFLPGTYFKFDNQLVRIGATGEFNFYPENPISAVYIQKATAPNAGTVNISYESKTQGLFQITKGIAIEEVVAAQLYGDNHTNFLLPYSKEKFTASISGVATDYNKQLSNIKTEVNNIIQLRFTRKGEQALYTSEVNLNEDTDLAALALTKENGDAVDFDKLSRSMIYPIYCGDGKESSGYALFFDHYYAVNPTMIPYDIKAYCAKINGIEYYTPELRSFPIEHNITITELIVGAGLIAELSYNRVVSSYSLEEENDKVKNVHDFYMSELEELAAIATTGDEAATRQKNQEVRTAYNSYMRILQKELEAFKEEMARI